MTEDEVLVFADECTLRLHPTLTRQWAIKGQQPKAGTWDNHQHVHAFGALDVETGQVNYKLMERLTADNFRWFLRQLIDARPHQKTILVVDNAGWHKAKLVKDFLAAHADRLELLHLPRYAPDLNPIERLWKWLRHRVTHNHCYDSLADLKDATRRFFAYIYPQPHRVLSYCAL